MPQLIINHASLDNYYGVAAILANGAEFIADLRLGTCDDKPVEAVFNFLTNEILKEVRRRTDDRVSCNYRNNDVVFRRVLTEKCGNFLILDGTEANEDWYEVVEKNAKDALTSTIKRFTSPDA